MGGRRGGRRGGRVVMMASERDLRSYRLDGNGAFRARVRATGSKDLMASGEGPEAAREEDGETSSESSVVPL